MSVTFRFILCVIPALALLLLSKMSGVQAQVQQQSSSSIPHEYDEVNNSQSSQWLNLPSTGNSQDSSSEDPNYFESLFNFVRDGAVSFIDHEQVQNMSRSSAPIFSTDNQTNKARRKRSLYSMQPQQQLDSVLEEFLQVNLVDTALRLLDLHYNRTTGSVPVPGGFQTGAAPAHGAFHKGQGSVYQQPISGAAGGYETRPSAAFSSSYRGVAQPSLSAGVTYDTRPSGTFGAGGGGGGIGEQQPFSGLGDSGGTGKIPGKSSIPGGSLGILPMLGESAARGVPSGGLPGPGNAQNTDDVRKRVKRFFLHYFQDQSEQKPVKKVPELIRSQGYPSEVHKVVTEDGYILELHRIPGPRRMGRPRKRKNKKKKFGKRSVDSNEVEDEEMEEEEEGAESNYSQTVTSLLSIFNLVNDSIDYNVNDSSINNASSSDRNNSSKTKEERSNASTILRSKLENLLPGRSDEMLDVSEMLQQFISSLQNPAVKTTTSMQSILEALQSDEDGSLLEDFIYSDEVQTEQEIPDEVSWDDDTERGDNRDTATDADNHPEPGLLRRLPRHALRKRGPSRRRRPSRRGPPSRRRLPPRRPPFSRRSPVPHPIPGSPLMGPPLSILAPMGILQGFGGPGHHPRIRPPVLIHHGLFASSANFVLSDAQGGALAYLLADAGYDVWMANWRGNSYSRGHVRLDPDHADFWNFSLDEIIQYDIPAIVDYILDVSQQRQLFYIGHSLGCAMFFGATNYNPSLNSKVRLMVAMAPAAVLDHSKGVLKTAILSMKTYYEVLDWFGIPDVPIPIPLRTGLARGFCGPETVFRLPCYVLLHVFMGKIKRPPREYYTNVLLSHFPGTIASTRIMAHFGQFVDSGGMHKFSFGPAENYRRYGQVDAPPYDFGSVTCPVAVIWGPGDTVISPQDVLSSVEKLPNVVLNYRVPDPTFNHLDFIFPEQAFDTVYQPILQLMRRY